jgi:succinyl-CoA:acetate CoA-transferase
MAGSERIREDLPVVQASRAAGRIPADASILMSGFGSVGYPKAVPEALAESGRDLSLAIVSGGSVGEEIDVKLVEADAISRRYPYQARPPIREASNNNSVAFSDRHISSLGDEVQYGGLVEPDVAIVEAVAVGEDWLVSSTSVGHTPAFVDSVDRLIVEVNTAQPRSLEAFHDIHRPGLPPNRNSIPISTPGERIGDSAVHFDPDSLEAVVETERRDEPYTFRDPTEDDLEIAANLREFLEAEVPNSPIFDDSVRIQFGVGSLGNALTSALGEADLGARDFMYYGEVIQDGLLDLLDDGQLQSASATSLALSSDGQDQLFENTDRYAEDIVLRPADLSNSPALIDRFGVIAVNSALEVDIYGHINSTHVNGTKIINGIGGSGDFTRNAPLSIIALPSTAVGGEVSRIVPMVPHVDHTEHDVDVVVTERGIADLRGASPIERGGLLINKCAHPSFREELQEYLAEAKTKGGHIPQNIESAFSWTK